MHGLKIAFVFLCLLAILGCNTPAKQGSDKDLTEPILRVQDFGAVGDGTTLSTEAIQAAIEQCSQDGGGTVLIAGGDFVSGTLVLRDHVQLHVAKDARLLGSTNPLHYKNIDPFTDAVGQQRGNCLIGAVDARDVALTGEGTVDGRGQMFQAASLRERCEALGINKRDVGKHVSQRPFLVRFVRCQGVKVAGLHLQRPAAWTCHLYQCRDIEINGLSIHSHVHKNNDGIDLDSSSNATIINCDIDTADDALCFKTTSPEPCMNVTVKDCRLKSHWGAIKFGTESMGNFENIRISDCTLYDTKGGGIKMLSVDGANIKNIRISDITMENVDMPLFMRLGERRKTYRDAPQQPVGSIEDVMIWNVTATTQSLAESRVSPPAGLFLTGTPNHKIGKVTLENIKITLPGGGTREMVSREVAEDEERYPEFSFFDVLPAFGLFARHMEGLTIKGLTVKTEQPDGRHPMVLRDVSDSHVLDTEFVGYEGFQLKLGKVPMTAKFVSETQSIWGGSLVKGEDGLYHMFYARWPKELGWAWVTHSEIAHAVSKSPFGPFEHKDVVLPVRGVEFWDGLCTHNPTIHKFDGKYYLYYMGNTGDGKVVGKPGVQKLNWNHRNNQRIGVAVADSPNGPWQRFDKPVLDVSPDDSAIDSLMTSNPSVCQGPDGNILMVYKAVGKEYPLPNGGPVLHGIATSKSPTGPFIKYEKPTFVFEGERFPAEDPYIWYQDGLYRAVVKRIEHVGKKRIFSLMLFVSADGFEWEQADNPFVSTLQVTWEDGRVQKLKHLERPQLYIENGKPVALLCAADTIDENNVRHSFNVQIPVE